MKNGIINTVKSDQNQAQIFGIPLSSTNKEGVLRYVREKVIDYRKNNGGYKPFFITTPNPEIILKTLNDESYKDIITSSDLRITDGIGVLAAHKFFSLKAPKNKLFRVFISLWQGIEVGMAVLFNPDWLKDNITPIKGREMFLDLIKLANHAKLRVYLLGGVEDMIGTLCEKLTKNYKHISIRGNKGPLLLESAIPVNSDNVDIQNSVIKDIKDFKPDMVFIGFGAPKQEKWVRLNLNKLNVGGVMCVGRTFEFVAGKFPSTPKWMEKVNLEWLWRLFSGSTSIKRIWNAVVVFPWKVFQEKIRQNQKF